MRVRSVAARNFGGANFDVDLAPITIISGANFSGKTSIPNAIKLALCGYLPPPLGVKGIYRLAGDPDKPGSMSVGLVMDNGRKVELKWSRDAKGKISATGGIPSDLLMPPMLANPASFWSKTGAERVQTIFESCPGAGKDLAATITARLGEIRIMPVKLLMPVLEEIRGLIKTGFEIAIPQDAADALLAIVKTHASDAAAQAKTLANAMTVAQAISTKLPDASAELEAARQELATITVSARTDKAADQKRFTTVTASLAAYSRKYQQTPLEHLAEFINAEAATVAKDLRTLRPAPPSDDVQEELDEAVTAEEMAGNENHRCAAEVSRLDAEYGNLQILTSCPVCLTKAAGWRERADKALAAKLEKARVALGVATAQFAAAKATTQRLRSTLDSIRKTTKEITEHRAELLREATDLETDRDNVQALMAELAELQASLSQESAPNENEAARANALNEKIARLQAQQTQRAQFDTEMGRREKLEIEYSEATVRAEAMKAAAAIIVEEQRKAGEAAFSTVLKTARHFTDGILNSPLEFIDGDLGRRVSEKDRQRPGFVAALGSWITHEVFSDSEKRIAYVGFSVAMASEAPVKLVIVDEMATMEESRKVQFVDRLIQLVRKGIIDQALCIEPSQKSYEAFAAEPEVKLIRL